MKKAFVLSLLLVFSLAALPLSAERQSGGAMPCPPQCAFPDPPENIVIETTAAGVNYLCTENACEVVGCEPGAFSPACVEGEHAALAEPSDYHDCAIYCDRLCREAIEFNHTREDACTNGHSQSVGARQGWCMWDWVGPTWTVQDCGLEGCSSTGIMRCLDQNGTLKFPSYSFECAYNEDLGGMPVQWIDKRGGSCVWPNGASVGMECSDSGGIVFTAQ